MSKFRETMFTVLDFWFGTIEDELCEKHKQQIWYQFDPQVDKEITDRFSELHGSAVSGKLKSWQGTAQGSLALIILLDQMSRNMFRGTAGAFEYDDLALSVCLEGIENGLDKELTLIEALFFYHPLEHAESLEHQERCVSLMQQLAKKYQGDQLDYVRNAISFAEEHRDIIRQFGRFPHRNDVMGRAATAEEQEYLSAGGKRFGQ